MSPRSSFWPEKLHSPGKANRLCTPSASAGSSSGGLPPPALLYNDTKQLAKQGGAMVAMRAISVIPPQCMMSGCTMSYARWARYGWNS